VKTPSEKKIHYKMLNRRNVRKKQNQGNGLDRKAMLQLEKKRKFKVGAHWESFPYKRVTAL